MRVISGSAKGRRLNMYEGQHTRPTTDKTKESLFAMLQFEIPDARFLDLYAGSGAIAIEALSRGADTAVLVEKSKKAAACIRYNLEKTGLAERASLHVQDVFQAINELGAAEDRFDVIFLDPPYDSNLENRTVRAVMNAGILKPEGLLVVESAADTEISGTGYVVEKERTYGITKLTFLRYRKDGEL